MAKQTIRHFDFPDRVALLSIGMIEETGLRLPLGIGK
jgi:hypothetical protein